MEIQCANSPSKLLAGVSWKYSLEYLVQFDGGYLFRQHILPRLELSEVDIAILLSLRTVSKAWLNQFQSTTSICLASSKSENRNCLEFYDALLAHFPGARSLRLLDNSGAIFLQHSLFGQLRKLSVAQVNLDATQLRVERSAVDFFHLASLTRLTSLSLCSAVHLRDRHLLPLVNLKTLKLRGPFAGVSGSCLAAFTNLEKLSILGTPSIQSRHFCQLNLSQLTSLRVNSSSLLKASAFTGTCTFMDSECSRVVYVGTYVNGLMDGRGVYHHATGARYEGEFEKGLRSGQGTYEFVGGNKYIGSWLNNVREGKGTVYYHPKGYYVGDWSNGTRQGYGVEEYQGGRYEGEWLDGKRHGFGISYHSNGETYEGQWVDNTRQGFGVYIWESGMKYEGQWEKNKREGEGVLHYNLDYDSDKRVGQWKENEPVAHTYVVGRQARQVVQLALASSFASLVVCVLVKMYRRSRS